MSLLGALIYIRIFYGSATQLYSRKSKDDLVSTAGLSSEVGIFFPLRSAHH